jgi:DNA modification methylase
MKIPIEQIEFTEPDLTKEVDQGTDTTKKSLENQLAELTDSMKEQGQLQAISVRPANSSEKPYSLNYGLMRLMAARRLEWTEIEVTVEDMTPRQAEIKRCHENLKRMNLPWYEQATQTERLHSLRQEEHGVAKSGRPAKNEEKKGWSVRDTAEELGIALGTISEDINLAQAVRANPSLRSIQDRKTAVKLIKQEVRREQARVDADAPKTIDVNEVYLGDSTVILSKLPDCSVDAVWTDPPWLNFFDATLKRDDRTFPVFKEVFRVMKFNTLCYIVIGFEDLPHYAGYERMLEDGKTEHVRGELERIGFEVAKTPVIWRKINALSRRGVKAWEYDRDFEIVVVAAKGSPVLTSQTRLSGVKEYAVVPSRSLVHPHEKPLALVEDFLKDCSHEGHVILDPFAGSGVLGEACKRTKRHYILIERDKERYDKIVKRLGKA